MKILNNYKKNINKVRGSFLLLLTVVVFSVKAQNKYTIVLDAGHGGKDSGASRGSYIEKDIALSLVLKAGKILEKNKDIKIVYTRKKDEFIELHKRAKIANDINADFFVSLHCNANNSAKPFGSETYVLGLSGNKANLEIVKKENEVILLENNYKNNYDYDPNSAQSLISLSVLQEENLDASLLFAGIVQSNFKKLKRYDRSVKQANFLVLRETTMPSVLIELGFLSNDKEGKFLSSKSGQNMMAGAIAKGVNDYVENLKLNTVKLESILEYKIQIAASKNNIETKSYNFRGLKEISSVKSGDIYKYFYGSSNTYEAVKEKAEEVKEAGYTDFFIVAYYNGVKISINEAKGLE